MQGAQPESSDSPLSPQRPVGRLPILVVLLLIGTYAQIVQAWLIRESLVVFYGNEISLGAFFGSWLLWIAAGAMAVVVLRRRRRPARPLLALRILVLALPVLLGAEVLALRVVRWILDVSAIQLIPLGELFWSLLLINLPVGVALGAAYR